MPPSLSIRNTGGVLSPNQIGMSADQRRLYDRLRQMGIADAVARQLAVAVAKSAEPRGLALAKAAMERGQDCKGYHQAFVEQAKAQMHPAFFDVLHRKARAVAGGSASGASRRAAVRTAESPDEFPLVADDDVIEDSITKADGATPPQVVRDACRRGLDLMTEHGGPGLTDGAKSRARAMADGQAVSPANIKRMRSFFARHDSYAKQATPPSPGYVAWMLWGGDAGKAWADSQAESLDKAAKPLGAAYARAKAKTKDKTKQKRIVNDYLREKGHELVGKSHGFATACAAMILAKGGPGSGPQGGSGDADHKALMAEAAQHHNKAIEAALRGDRGAAKAHSARATEATRKAVSAASGKSAALAKTLGPLVQEMVAVREQDTPKKKKKVKRVGVSLDTKIVKAEETPWQRLVYSTVYAPDELDTDGDFMDPATIEKAAHEAMANGIYINHEHAGEPIGAHVVESYIAPCDMNLGQPDGEPLQVSKGTWMMALKVTDPDIWQGVLDGTYGGFSLEGSALAEMAAAAE